MLYFIALRSDVNQEAQLSCMPVCGWVISSLRVGAIFLLMNQCSCHSPSCVGSDRGGRGVMAAGPIGRGFVSRLSLDNGNLNASIVSVRMHWQSPGGFEWSKGSGAPDNLSIANMINNSIPGYYKSLTHKFKSPFLSWCLVIQDGRCFVIGLVLLYWIIQLNFVILFPIVSMSRHWWPGRQCLRRNSHPLHR